ncbi:MAG: beta-galactosidase [Pseudomonadota bacterium]
MKRTLGTCYYPEHWPEEIWAEDAARMADLGLTWVRIGEFAWRRIEPGPGEFDWGWLDRAIEILGDAGLRIVLGTPTATPPRWTLDRHPDMLAVDVEGRPRGFGSRRHYCFSHAGYLAESKRITAALAERYGRNPHIAAWQTDNEYGCHDTILSYSEAARHAFRDWLAERYGTVAVLNAAWGNVFWSIAYNSFDQVDLPNLTVTEANPAHGLAFRRFSSDQVVAFNRAQVDIIRAASDAPVMHNYMGRITDFDHFEVGEDLDFATWDSYPLGFLEDRVGATPQDQRHFARQGDPDFQAFHHDLYRAVGKGRWWVVEQQPGPVNWAPSNPAPLPGMVRLWTWEAFAHGAEAVCYFRWRQAPFAQEQMHAGLLRPDHAEAPGMTEARQVMAEIADAPDVVPKQAPVALIFDYDADAAWAVQPHGMDLSYFGLVFDMYRALRGLGLSIDIVSTQQRDFDGYRLICAPGLVHMSDDLKAALARADQQVLLGPRSGARDAEFSIPVPLPPDLPDVDLCVTRVESLRADMPRPLAGGGAVQFYREEIEGSGAPLLQTEDGDVVALKVSDSTTYLAAWCDAKGLGRLLKDLCFAAGLATMDLPRGLRCREAGDARYWFNYNPHPIEFEGFKLPAAGVFRQAM